MLPVSGNSALTQLLTRSDGQGNSHRHRVLPVPVDATRNVLLDKNLISHTQIFEDDTPFDVFTRWTLFLILHDASIPSRCFIRSPVQNDNVVK